MALHTHKLKKPETGGTPKRITTKAPPGGDQTPGAKALQAELERKRKIRDASVNNKRTGGTK